MSSYRDPIAPPAGRVVHGPFPVRVGLVALGVLVIFAGLLILSIALDDARLDCDRGADRCVYSGSRFGPGGQTFARSRLGGVRVEIEAGAKGARYGRPYLVLSDRELPLAQVSVQGANAFAQRLEAARTHGDSFGLDLPAEHGFAVPGGLLIVAGIAALLAAFRRTGRVVMVVRGAVLHLSRSAFGIPLSSAAVEIAGVTDVEVEWEGRTTLFSPRNSVGDTHGRLVLARGAEREPLTAMTFPGYHVHLRAERELRDVLGLPARTREREEALSAKATGWKPAPFMGGNASYATFLGACCGALLGLPLALLLPFGATGRAPSTAVFAIIVLGGAAIGVVVASYLRRRAAAR